MNGEFDPDAYLSAGSAATTDFDPDAYLGIRKEVQPPSPTPATDSASSMLGKIGTAVKHNIEPFIQHPLEAAYEMVVPTMEDIRSIGNLAKAETYKQNLQPGSQEWYDKVLGYSAPLILGAAAKGVGIARGIKPETPAAAPEPVAPEPAAPRGPVPIEAQIGGEKYAQQISETAPLHGDVQYTGRPEEGAGEVPAPVSGEGVPARGQGEVVAGQPRPAAEEAVAPEPPTEPSEPPPPSGFSTERLQNTYGDDAVLITKGKGAKAWQATGEADPRDPYAVLTDAQQRGIATPEDTAKLRNEHQKILSAARQAYGTPRYNELAQQAVDLANATKTVAHGPASDVFRALQESDQPAYDSPADFDNIIRERMQREASLPERKTFQKAADEVRSTNGDVNKSAADAQKRLARYKPKETMRFEDAVDSIKNQIKDLTGDCIL